MSKPIHDVIEILKRAQADWKSETLDDAIAYLMQLEDMRRSIFDRDIVGYWGRMPVTKIGGTCYAIRDYVPKHRAWRCWPVEWSDIHDDWSPTDDDNWLIDRDGHIVCKERGWDLREVKPDE